MAAGITASKSSHARPRRMAAAALLTALTLTGCTDNGEPTAADAEPVEPAAAAEDLEATFQDVIRQVLPSVVEIRSTSGLGSGVVIDDGGNIVTNAHVVGTEQQFQVLASGSDVALEATLVGTYPPNDIAVVRVTAPDDLRPADFGDSSDVRVGQMVLAMGNPLGLESTVTNGIVSAKGRTVSEPPGPGSPGATIPDAIQTSADINPGNSGGALVDLEGEVVGIPTLAAVNPEVGSAAPGIGFAIPSNQAMRLAEQLVEDGVVTDSGRAALGVRVRTVVDQSGEPAGVGVVDVVPDGPAAAAGLQPGDVIVSVDGKDTPTSEALGAVLAELKPGDTVPVVVRRGGAEQKVEVTLGEL